MAIVANDYQNKVNAYYQATFGREATAAELAAGEANLLANGGSVWSGSFQQSLSTTAGWGTDVPTQAAAEAQVETVLQNAFGSTYSTLDSSIATYYVTNLVSGSIKPRGLVNAVLNDLGLMPKVDGSLGKPAGWGYGPSVTLTDAQVEAYKADTGFSTTGQVYTLTTDPDHIQGTSGNDTINGVSAATAAAATDTLTAADIIDGGDGTDTLSVVTTAPNTNILHGALVSNVETLAIRNTSGADTFDASQIAGLNKVVANQGTGSLVVTNLAKDAVVSVEGNGTVVNGEVAFTYATPTDAVTLDITGGTKMTAGITAKAALGGTATGTATSATIISTGAGNTVGTVDLADASLTSVTITAVTGLKGDFLSQATDQVGTDGVVIISGSAKASDISSTQANAVEFTNALDDTIKTIDASGLTNGGLKATVGSGTETIKGGAGSDDITLAAGVKTATLNAGDDTVRTTNNTGLAATAAGSINGGDGNDTLVVRHANDVDTAAERAVFTSFEVLNNATAAAIAADGFSGTTSVVSSVDGAGFTQLSATQAAAVTNTIAQTGTTYALASDTGASDVLTITAKSATATTAADLTGLTVDGFETMNVTALSGNADATNAEANHIAFTAADSLTSLNLAGAYGFNVVLDNTSKAITVANTLTGTASMQVEGEVIKGSSITTTANADTVETALAHVAGVQGDFVTYNTGAGNDVITTSLPALNNTNNGFASLKIDGGDGTDTLHFAATDATFTDPSFQYVTNVEAITLHNTSSLTFQGGGFFGTNFSNGFTLTTASLVDTATMTIDVTSATGNAKIVATSLGVGDSTGEDLAINTGSGNDDVTLTASSWTGAAGGSSGISIGTGVGDDKISLTIGDLAASTAGDIVINGGKGADTITVSHSNDTTAAALINFKIADGDSTAASYDKITGFLAGDGTDHSDVLDLDSTTLAAATTGTNGTDVGNIKSHAITNAGIITFDDADTYVAPIVINAANVGDVLSYLATNITTAGATVAFAYDSNSDGAADATMVFQQGASDTVVELVGVTGVTALGASATTAHLVALG